ncbi:MAG: hypothetical protein DCF16_08380 [Alphaproteobacteria bacterium]|nr:MAG: hypothetical protein DCF16_08380 [Alphaproteobacteria bacterium]
MPFALNDVIGWSDSVFCTPTALAAISGRNPAEIGRLLAQCAVERGEYILDALRPDYNINDWLRAVRMLGGEWREIENFSKAPFSSRPTISEWMSNRRGDVLCLVHCDEDGAKGHVFATNGSDVVDTYTRGRKMKFSTPDPDFQAMRVKHVFHVV